MNWRSVTQWALTLHIYVAMAGFGLLFFFAITGLTLNHQDFGMSTPRVAASTLPLPAALVNRPTRDDVEAFVRRSLGVRSPLSSYREFPDEIELLFTEPGSRVQLLISRADGTAQVERETRGFWGVLGDLHKGRDSGRVWSWVIDLTAVLFVFTSVTGMVTLASRRARRRLGFALAAVGAVVAALVYFVFGRS